MRLRLTVSILSLLTFLPLNAQRSGRYFTLDNCINHLYKTNVEPNRAGWAYWFIPKGVADTLTVKMSSVSLMSGTHDPHSHHEDECFYIVQGPVIVHLNGEEMQLETGDIFYTPGGSSHSIRRASEDPIKYLVLKRETVEKLDRSFPVGKEDYTLDDCCFFPSKNRIWSGTGNSSRMVCVDEKFSGGLRIELVRVGVNSLQSQKPAITHRQKVFYILDGVAEVTLGGDNETIGSESSFYCPKESKYNIKQRGNRPLVYLEITTF